MPVDEAELTQYALGILDEGASRAMQRKIAASPALQEKLTSICDALQLIAVAEEPLRPSDRLRNLVLDSTLDKSRFDGFFKRFSELFDLEISDARNLLAKIDQVSGPDWESALIPGVKIMKFAGGPQVASATCGIVQVEPGVLFPAHQHRADERILVLQGAARDDKAKVIAAGDMYLFTAGSRHSFRIIGNEAFVFAVVLQKQNKWLLVKTLVDHLRIKK